LASAEAARTSVERIADLLGILRADQAEETFAVACPGITVFAPSPV
jgi:hypothetical protein